MKNIPLLLLALLLSQFLVAQKIIEKPRFAFSTAGGLEITKIELTNTSTICQFVYSARSGTGFMIPDKSFISPNGTSERLFITNAEKIPINQWVSVPETGKYEYTLHFPKIDPATKYLEFGEGNDGGSWFIYEIELEKKPYQGAISEELTGYWCKTDGSKELVVALFDTCAVYQSQLWKYGKVSANKKQLTVELKNTTGTQTIKLKPTDTNNLTLASAKNEEKLSKTAYEIAGYSNPNDKPYTLPLISVNGKATYKGIISNFNPKYVSQKTGQIHVDNVITGNQDTYTVNIANDGTFSITFPKPYPGQIYVQMPMFYESVYVEPGKETFHIFDNRSNDKNLFMGETAILNQGFMTVKNINHFDYQKMQDEILNLSPKQYLDYCLDSREKDMHEFDSIANTRYLSPKVIEAKKKGFEYSAYSNFIEYKWDYENAYRKKNNIPNDKRDVVIAIPPIDTTLFAFLTNNLVNDPLAIISSEYKTFINRIKFLDVLRGNDRSGISSSVYSLFKLGKDAGLIFTTDEEALALKANELERDSLYRNRLVEISTKYDSVTTNFFKKHQKLIEELSENKSFSFIYDLQESFKVKGIELSADEHKYFDEMKSLQSREKAIEVSKASIKFYTENQEAIVNFRSKYDYLIDEIFQTRRKTNQDKAMKRLFGIETGLASDIMYAQDLCRGIVEEATPLENNALNRKLKNITTPVIAEYIRKQNENTIAKLETNKQKTGYAVNIAPSVEADKLFDAMLAKFKGKVVYVDFWATWCGPCRSGIERIKSLKEEMAGKDIVFLYITGPSSPEGTWKNMIPDIKGEHYRVNADEWNTICGKFNISGIPHYALVDKNGVVAKNDGMPDYDLNAMKKLFEEFLAK